MIDRRIEGMKQLAIDAISWSSHQLVLRFTLDRLTFSTTYWYPETDLLELEQRFGREMVERLFLHVALFEINKIASLRPESIHLGRYAGYLTEGLARLWTRIFEKVWAQWRYENSLPDEPPPRFADSIVHRRASPVRRDRQNGDLLLFCGGGKDSLVAMKLLERAGIPYASLAYSSSVYGAAKPQLRLIDRLLDAGIPTRRHRQIVLDDFFDAPVLELYGEELGVQTVTAAETPGSIFATLPVLLAHGYGYAVLGHEASSNRGNLVWSATGEEVNHQWGKSVEAERLLDDYIRTELIEDIGVFSLLMPIHDPVIFELLQRDERAIVATHSCNIVKPWCRRCPKCAYVWLSYRGYLAEEPVQALFGEELLEVAENYGFFEDMVGLGEHTPFECIGQIEESRLALSLCVARGLAGPRGLELAGRVPPLDVEGVIDTFARVHADTARLPEHVASRVLPLMEEAAVRCRERIRRLSA